MGSQRTNSRFSGFGKWLALSLGMVLVVGAGALYGHYSQRWGPPADLQAVAESLRQMPKTIGKWHCTEDLEIEASTVEMLDCAGYVNRRYSNPETGETINLAIMVGPPGPIAVHTPEVCYSSRNYEIQTERAEFSVEDSKSVKHSFWGVRFASKNVISDRLMVYYAWNPGDRWKAADSPRFQFGANKMLLKIQLACMVPNDSKSMAEDPCKDFLAALLASGWNVAGEQSERS